MGTTESFAEPRLGDNPVPLRVTALLLVVGTVLLSPTLSFRMGADQGSYAYMAAELLNGHWPYIATWDHQFPGGWVLHAAEILLFGKSVWMFRVFDLLYQLAIVYLVFRITRRLADLPSAFLAACLYCLIYQSYGPWNTGQREGFGLLFILIGFWLYLTRAHRSPELTAAGIGLGLGLAVTIKPTMLALSGLYFPLVLQFRLRHLRLLLLATGALLLPTALFVVFYWTQGALQDMYDACLGFTSQVYIHQYGAGETLAGRWLERFGQLGATAKIMLVGYLPFLFFGAHRTLRWMLYTGYAGSVFAVLAQGTFAGYHYLPGLGTGAIMIGTMFHSSTVALPGIRRRLMGTRGPGLQAVLASVLVLAAGVHYVNPVDIDRLIHLQFLERPAPNEFRNSTVFDFTESWDMAEYIRAHTAPDDRIQVWGFDALVYYLAERRAASRFQSTTPLVVRVPGRPLTAMQQAWRSEFMTSMHDNPPAIIAVVQQDDWWWAPDRQSSWQLLDDFPEWKAFIFDHYTRDADIGRFAVFRQKSS